MATQTKSGKSLKLIKLSVQFREWEEIGSALGPKDQDPRGLLGQLLNVMPPSAYPKVKKPTLVRQGWVYVFRKNPKGISLTIEAQVFDDHGVQKYKLVSWSKPDREKWLKTYPRTTISKTFEKFLLDVDVDNYILYSGFQLPFARVEYYRRNPHKLSERAVRVPAALQVAGSAPVDVVLLDFIKLANAFQADYMKSLDDYEKVLSDMREGKVRYQADVIWNLAEKEGRIKRWFRFEELEKYREDQSKKIERVALAKDRDCARKCNWMRSIGYIETRDDHNGDVDIEKLIQKCEADLLDGNLQSPEGLEYLEEVAGDEKSWYYRYFFADEPLQIWRKSIDANEKVPLLLLEKFIMGRIARLLPKTAPEVKVVMHATTEMVQVKIVEEVSQILTRRNLIIGLELKAGKDGKMLWVEKATEFVPTTRIRYELTTATVLRPQIVVDTSRSAQAQKRVHELEKWKEGVEKAGYLTKKVLLIVELINFATSAKAFADAKGKYESTVTGVNLAGAVADSLSASKFLVEKTVGEEAMTRVGKKAFTRISIIGSICDYFVGVSRTYENFMDDKPGLALGYATTALAATALGAAAALELTGAAAFGLSATWYTGIGAILFVGGSILIYIFTDEPFEAWAKTSVWSEKISAAEASQQGEGDLNRQIAALHELMAEFKVQCQMYATSRPVLSPDWPADITYHGFRLRINPGLFDASKSRFVAHVKIEGRFRGEFGWRTVVDWWDQPLVLPDGRTHKDRDPESGLVRTLDVCFTKDECRLPDDFHIRDFRYQYSVRLDFGGDGLVLYPSKGPKEEDGEITTHDRYGIARNIAFD